MASEVILFLLLLCALSALARDRLYQGGVGLNSSVTLVSKDGHFELGFQKIGSTDSNASYLGIWYDSDENPFWSANREKPIADDSGVLCIGDSGNLSITYFGSDVIPIYSSQSPTTNLTAILENSGNFVVKDASSASDQILWDYPTDVFSSGMTLGINRRTGKVWSLTSWVSDLFPSPGAFTMKWDPSGKELVDKMRDTIFWSSGPLGPDNLEFTNFPMSLQYLNCRFIHESNLEEDYIMFSVSQKKGIGMTIKNFTMLVVQNDGGILDKSSSIVFGICDGNNTDRGCKQWECRRGGSNFAHRVGNFKTQITIGYDSASLGISDCMDICWKDCECNGVNYQGRYATKLAAYFFRKFYRNVNRRSRKNEAQGYF